MKMIVSVGIISLTVLAIFVQHVEVVYTASTAVLMLGILSILSGKD